MGEPKSREEVENEKSARFFVSLAFLPSSALPFADEWIKKAQEPRKLESWDADSFTVLVRKLKRGKLDESE